MRQLDFSASLPPQRAEQHNSRTKRWTDRLAPGSIGALPILIAVAAGVYFFAQSSIRIDPRALALASSLTDARTNETSVVVNGAVADNLIAAGFRIIRLRVNGVDQPVAIENKNFTKRVVLTRGRNTIQAIAGNIASKPITILADLPAYDIWIELSWIGKGDVDLYLLLPNGEECSYHQKTTPSGARLDFDNTVSDGPEHIVMEKAIAGTYRVRINYYAENGRDPRVPINCHITLKLRDSPVVSTFERVLYKQGDWQDVDVFSF